MIKTVLRSFSRPLYHLECRAFVTVPPTLDFSQYKTIYKRTERNDEFNFMIPSFEEKIEFNLPEEATVNDLIKEITQSSKGIKSCHAITMDKVEIAGITKLEDIKADNFYILVNQSDLLKIVTTETTESEERDKKYQKVESYCESIGVPFIERKIIVNYLKRVDQHTVENFNHPLFADKNFYTQPFDKEILIDNLVEGLSNNRNQRVENEQALYNEYNKVKGQLEDLKIKRSELEQQVYAHQNDACNLIFFCYRLIKRRNLKCRLASLRYLVRI